MDKSGNYPSPSKGDADDTKIEHLEENTVLDVRDAEVAYGKNGIPGLIGSPYVFGAACLASMGGFSFGYDQGVISIINVMPQFHAVFPRTETAFGKSFMTGMLELGAFIGCLFMPALCDRISRKWALTVAVVVFNIGAIMQTAAPNYAVLVAGRAIGGIGVGTLAMGAPIYISELSPPNLRGTLLVLESICIVSGVVISFYTTYGTRHIASEVSFRLPFGLQMVSATLLGVGLLFYPFSPRWLALVGRDEECLKVLTRLRGVAETDSRVQAEFNAILTEVKVEKAMQEKHHPGVSGFKLEMLGWLDLLKKKSWRRTAVAVGATFFQQFSGINGFIYYAPTLFASLGQDPDMALTMSGIFNVLQLVGVAICFVIIDHVGRRPLAIWGALSGATTWGIMAVLTGIYSDDWGRNPAAGWAAVAMAFIFILAFGMSYSCLGWILPAEVYTGSSRAKGVAIAVCVNWLCNFTVGVATPPMLESIGFGMYVFYGSMCAIGAVWAYFLVPETMGKTLEQMDFVFKDFAAKEERELFESVAKESP
ncbi:general substrate transporter [Plenodomus tracheiphilus IPT5]|uniref:General substrate transporter n=1 Tax=Plenodomus tracheiphilus IPT5 TaxID=1408161 RepID=A0A6A7AYQ4_9PLEO|nr:general substrate transporter [Plenodomus tracheiphilus IPT5]